MLKDSHKQERFGMMNSLKLKYLCPPAKLHLEDAAQAEGDGPRNCGAPGEEPQSLGQLHPFLKGELHLHHHHGCSE